MHRYLLYFLFSCICFSFMSCKKEKLKSPEASFLVVDAVSINTTPSQGSNSHKIVDIWYYVDGQFKGVFPVGNVMPIVAKNNAEITLFAGIKNNGISATRMTYQFYNPVTYVLNIESGKTYSISPQFEYSSSAIFAYSQNFDSAGSQFMSAGDSAYQLISDPAKTFGGSGKSVFMSMGNNKPTSKMVQSTPYFLPTSGVPIYLELNYKCNQPITVGVIGGGTEERGAITLNSTDDWNKIYIQLTGVVSAQPTYAGYQVYIKATKEVDTPEIYIDNIKLITQ